MLQGDVKFADTKTVLLRASCQIQRLACFFWSMLAILICATQASLLDSLGTACQQWARSRYHHSRHCLGVYQRNVPRTLGVNLLSSARKLHHVGGRLGATVLEKGARSQRDRMQQVHPVTSHHDDCEFL